MTKNENDPPAEPDNESDAPEKEVDEAPAPESPEPEKPRKHHKLKQLWHWTATHKKITIPVAVLVVLLVLAAIPYTRFAAAGLFLKQTVTVEVKDTQTGRAVSSADVKLGNVSATTDEQGRAELHVGVGYRQLEVSKKYYEGFSAKTTVPLTSPDPIDVSLQATGRPVPVKVINAISREPLKGANVSAEGSEVRTDESGTALIVLPADQGEVDATISSEKYNTAEAKLKVTTQEAPENTFKLTPSGNVYFLSNQSGNIDVIKTNLDGTGRKTVLAGTGSEVRHETVLLASRDWRYLALLSKRDGGEHPKLFLIDTKDDQVAVMDEGDATFELVGWSGHRFVYKVDRENKENWEPNKHALKSFNAESKSITTLDETEAEGNQFDHFYEWFGRPYILADEIVYSVNISGSGPQKLDGKEATLSSVKADGSNKHTLAGYGPAGNSVQSLNTRIYNPNEVYFVVNFGDDDLYEYEGGGSVEKIESKTAEDLYQDNYFTYLVSPNGKRTFWSENRDGKNTMFVGNEIGENGEQIAVLSEFTSYGWFTDDYLLVSKDGSELYIMPASGVDDESDLLKVSDYFRPSQTFPGYGYGYGGGL